MKALERVRKEIVDGTELFDDPVVVLIDLAEVCGVYMLMLARNSIMCEREDATMLKLKGDAVKRVLSIQELIDYVEAFANIEDDPGDYADEDYERVAIAFEQDPWMMIYTVLGAWA
jgi:hypothetical protein